MRAKSTEEMKKLENIIMPYINFGPGPRFKEGTPKEILEAQEKLTQLSIQQTLDSAI